MTKVQLEQRIEQLEKDLAVAAEKEKADAIKWDELLKEAQGFYRATLALQKNITNLRVVLADTLADNKQLQDSLEQKVPQ